MSTRGIILTMLTCIAITSATTLYIVNSMNAEDSPRCEKTFAITVKPYQNIGYVVYAKHTDRKCKVREYSLKGNGWWIRGAKPHVFETWQDARRYLHNTHIQGEGNGRRTITVIK